jgi:hypothetical protein
MRGGEGRTGADGDEEEAEAIEEVVHRYVLMLLGYARDEV